MSSERPSGIERLDLFSIPVWRMRLPELDPHVETLRSWFHHAWQRGDFRRNAHGYGYQSPPTLFNANIIARQPALGELKRAFATRALEVLRQRTNHHVHLPPEAYAFMAWVLVQTDEEWVQNSWHDHAPALLSGCYYLQIPETDEELEGALAFMRPGMADAFVRQIQCVVPREGDFIMFPSSLTHRPQPTPTAKGLRISINMDVYVRWEHWEEEGRPIDQKAYRSRVLASVDPDAEPPPNVG